MRHARCLSCGFGIVGRWKNGPPKACPKCGATDSKEKLKAALAARIKK